jgi:hypothetical protein
MSKTTFKTALSSPTHPVKNIELIFPGDGTGCLCAGDGTGVRVYVCVRVCVLYL